MKIIKKLGNISDFLIEGKVRIKLSIKEVLSFLINLHFDYRKLSI
jgi:hypothetical protein